MKDPANKIATQQHSPHFPFSPTVVALAVAAVLTANIAYAADPVATPVVVAEPAAANVAAAATSEAKAGDVTVDLDQIVITSRKTPLLRVKEVPQSISVISGEDLKKEDVVSLEGALKRLSNVKWNYGNTSTSNYSMRGIGKAGNVDGADPSVGINLDGVGLAFNQMAYFNLFDVESLEASHGPQGTQFGKNATIGGIKVNYKRPTFTPYKEVSVGFSKYQSQDYARSNGSVKATAVTNGPIVDGLLAYRVGVNVDKGAGWIENSYNTDNTYINSDRVSGRLQLLLTPSSDFDARLSLDVAPRNSENANIGSTNYFFSKTPSTYANGAANTSLTNEQRLARNWFTRNTDYTVANNYYSQSKIASDSQQGVVSGSNGATLELNWNASDKTRVTSSTSFKDYYFNAFRDDEGTVFDVLTAAGQNKVFSQFTQEVRVASSVENLVDFQSGVFLQRALSDSIGNNIYGSDGGAWYATNNQYNALVTNAGTNAGAGRALLVDSVNDLHKTTPSKVNNLSKALFFNGDWRVNDDWKVNTGYRISWEDREITQGSGIAKQGYGVLLNPEATGGFNSNSTTGALTSTSATAIANANALALRYFGVATYNGLTAAQRTLVANAKAIRSGQIGTSYDPFTAQWSGTVNTVSVAPKYRVNEYVSTYLSLSYGEKSGLPVIRAAASPYALDVKPEKNQGYELGVKSDLLGGQFVLNAAVYVNNISDYQQSVYYYDPVASATNGVTTYASGTGNVDKVRTQGLEVDGVYTGIRNVSIRFAGAYNDAYYEKFDKAPCPAERNNECSGTNPYLDYTGKTLPGVSKYSYNIGAVHTLPVANGNVLKSGFNTTYQSQWNSDNALSDYSWIDANYVTDLTFSYGDAKDSWSSTFFVKNAFNDNTPRNKTWNAWAPGFERQFGFVFSSKL